MACHHEIILFYHVPPAHISLLRMEDSHRMASEVDLIRCLEQHGT